MARFRINFDLLAKVKEAKAKMKQPKIDDRYGAIRVNYQLLGRVMEAKHEQLKML